MIGQIFINGLHAGMKGVGQGMYARRLLEGLRNHANFSAYQVTVLAPESIADGLEERLSPLRIARRPMPKLGHDLINSIAWNYKLLDEISRLRPTSVFFSPGPCWGPSVPTHMAVTHHDCINHYFPAYMGRRLVRKWTISQGEKFLKKAGLVFTQSEHAAQDIHRFLHVSRERLIVIPAWLPREFTIPNAQATEPRTRTRYALPQRYWLYIGGYDVRKNVDFLIRAYVQARTQTDCPTLVLAGNIPESSAPVTCDIRKAITESGLGPEAIVEPGFIDDDDLPGLYAGAELFIYPSLMEGYGLPPLEAMGCGCPAIVADNSSLREVVTDEEYRFDAASLDRLVELMVEAAIRPRPLNPGFDRRRHDEACAIKAYLNVLSELGRNSQ